MNASELPSLAQIDREIGLRGSFYDFVRMAWPLVSPHEFRDGWHIQLICDELELVFRCVHRNTVFAVPPGHSKSSLVSVLWPVWCWIRDPALAFFGTSFDKTLTFRDASLSLTLIQSEWFAERWGDLVAVDKMAGVGIHSNSKGGWRFSTSVESKGTGRHPDIVIIDDPTKPKDVSITTLAETEAYWNNTLRSRGRDPRTVRRVLIMQRLAVRDLAGIFELEGGWHFVVLPLRYEPARAYSLDPRKSAGELLWPARLDEEAAKDLEKMPPRDRAAQLQQRPVPEGGAIIKTEWIKWYRDGGTGCGTRQDPAGTPRFSQKIQTWDLSFKDTKSSHFVAGQVWGVSGPNFYFIDGILERLDFVASCVAILVKCEAHPGCGVLVEDKANGPAVIAMLKSKIPGLIAVEPEGGKDARLNAVSPLFEAGNVFLPIGHPIAEILALSLAAFPAGEQDDDVDACTQVLHHLHEGVVDYAAAMKGLRGGFF